MNKHPDFVRLERDFGIHIDAVDYVAPQYARDFALAMDAQPALVSVSNAGIPAYLANYIDPKLIEVLTAPNKAAQILGERKAGDWTTLTYTFPVVEHTGEVATYGDYNANGSVGVNSTFPVRQSYHYQTVTQWGEKQLEVAGLAKIDYASRLNIASALVLDKFQNESYFRGVAGLQCYGLLNDPGLPAAIQPGAKAFGAAAHGPWITAGVITATANEIYSDIQSLYVALTTQTKGLIDPNSRVVLVTDPASATALTATNTYNVNVYTLLKGNFPNIRFETAPQYATAGGNLVQLIAEELDGGDVGFVAFTEKMRAHAIIRDSSSFSQKKSQGTWGAVIVRPVGVAQMLGV